MEKLKLAPRCKLCTLYSRDVALWEEVHRRVLIIGESRPEVCKWLNTRIEVLNAGFDPSDLENYITPFVPTTFQRHFRLHVISVEEMERVLSAGAHFTNESLRAPVNNPGHAFDPVTHLKGYEDAGAKIDDYCRMDRLVEAAEVRLTDYNQRLSQKSQDEDAEPVDLSEIQLFQKLIKELMGMKKELAVLQTSEAIAGNAIQESIEQLVNLTISTLKDVLIEMKNNIAREMPGSTLPEQMQSLVLNKMGEALKESVPLVISATYKKYKIK